MNHAVRRKEPAPTHARRTIRRARPSRDPTTARRTAASGSDVAEDDVGQGGERERGASREPPSARIEGDARRVRARAEAGGARTAACRARTRSRPRRRRKGRTARSRRRRRKEAKQRRQTGRGGDRPKIRAPAYRASGKSPVTSVARSAKALAAAPREADETAEGPDEMRQRLVAPPDRKPESPLGDPGIEEWFALRRCLGEPFARDRVKDVVVQGHGADPRLPMRKTALKASATASSASPPASRLRKECLDGSRRSRARRERASLTSLAGARGLAASKKSGGRKGPPPSPTH